MAIIQCYLVPYTSEYAKIGTAQTMALSTALYAPQTGYARGQLANQAFISVEFGNVRYRLLNTAPATACGHVLAALDYLSLDDVNQMQNIRFFNEGATATAYVHVTYFAG